MSVSETLTLPGQPTTGDVSYEGLGGDGLTAPHAAYHVSAFELTGDASSGITTQTIVMDDRYVSLLGFLTLRMTQVNDADEIVRFQCAGGARMPRVSATRTLTHFPGGAPLGTQEIADTWVPPPMMTPGQFANSCTVSCANKTNNIYLVDAVIYLFNIDVRQKYPLGPLFWARGVGEGV